MELAARAGRPPAETRRQEPGIPPETRIEAAFRALAREGSNVSSGMPGSCARLRSMKQLSRRSQIFAALCAALTILLVAAPLALAENGVGLAGPTTDKTVTFFCFGVIAFFAVLVIVMSLIQGRLEKRKDMRKHTLDRLS